MLTTLLPPPARRNGGTIITAGANRAAARSYLRAAGMSDVISSTADRGGEHLVLGHALQRHLGELAEHAPRRARAGGDRSIQHHHGDGRHSNAGMKASLISREVIADHRTRRRGPPS